jgi:glycerol kinase
VVTETTALGAAYAAGLATGVWSSTADLISNWGIGKTWTPRMPEQKREAYYASWQKAVSRAFDWVT